MATDPFSGPAVGSLCVMNRIKSESHHDAIKFVYTHLETVDPEVQLLMNEYKAEYNITANDLAEWDAYALGFKHGSESLPDSV